jgi:hypothetical protein
MHSPSRRRASALLSGLLLITALSVSPTWAAPGPEPASPETAAEAAPASRCPVGVPGAAPAGWARKVTSTFSETRARGTWPGPVAAAAWKNRAAGARDSSGRGTYDSSRTVSESNGLLDIWIHSETDARRGVHDPAGKRYVAAVVSKLPPMKGARITICMRADVIPGYKLAYMLWPSEGNGNQLGEIDYPETRLIGPPATSHAFMHYAPKPSSGRHQDFYDTRVSIQGWHAYTIEWNPRAPQPYAAFYLDGRLIGVSTRYIPTVAMNLILQHETFVSGQALPPPAQGHVQIDWVTIDVPTGSASASHQAAFADITFSTFRADIEWLVDANISGGCGGGLFCPNAVVSRAQMASFLSRASGLAASARNHFGDDDGSMHEPDINRVADAAITGGCASRRYCPAQGVSRAQMASFLARALSLPATSRDYFSDDSGSMHEDAINRLAASGIARGCADGRFCPSASITRGAMAAFLHRAYD